jgi:hypothetical protein
MAWHARLFLTSFAAAYTILTGLSHAQLPPRGEPFETKSERRTFKATATTTEAPPTITLHWVRYGNSESPIVIVRRKKGAYAGGAAKSWGRPYAVLNDQIDSFVDSNVEIGVQYEYRIQRNKPIQYDVVVAGLQIPLAEKRGELLLLVDDNHVKRLEKELGAFQFDLAGDGWDVETGYVSALEPVVEVKARIQEAYQRNPDTLKAVLLFGHIPVPYSGPYWGEKTTVPDGHANHMGAWPADNFYFELDGKWTDERPAILQARRAANHNEPGDGKYDQIRMTSNLELMGGRVDLHKMPLFRASESELLRNYLRKNRRFKHGLTPAANRILISDKEWPKSDFSMTGWMLASITGATDIYQASWKKLLENDYLFAFGVGPGSFRSARTVAHTKDYVKNDYQAIFQFMFGSGFGDWDTVNGLLRAPLASENYGLATAWGHRPMWFFDHMALGECIGYGAWITGSDFGFHPGTAARPTYANLMGDPTLRARYIKPVADLRAKSSASEATLSWTLSPEKGIVEQRVYRSDQAYAHYKRVAILGAKETSFTDKSLPPGPHFYMVRAVALTESASGTYYNGSIGIVVPVQAKP